MQQSVDNMQAYREAGLKDFGRRLVTASRRGILGDRIKITDVETVAGPRAGALHIFAGLETGKLQRALAADDAAIPLALLPEEFDGKVHVYRHGRYLRVESPWVRSLQVKAVPLHRMTKYPHRDGAWTVGIDEFGRSVRATLNTGRTPHYMIAGTTGAGKTESLVSIIVQIAAAQERYRTRMVILDGKRGRLLVRSNNERLPANLRNLIAPVATVPDKWRSAAVWCEREMERRFTQGHKGKLIMIIDELPEIVQDPVAKAAIKRIAKLGRDVEVHMIAAAQHPTVDNIGGNEILRCLVGRIGFLVTDNVASRVVVGGPHPRLDLLMGEGDGYAISPTACCRVLGPIVTSETVVRMKDNIFGDPCLPEWPEVEAESLGQSAGRPSPWPSGAQVGIGMMCAALGIGRPTFQGLLQAAGTPERTTNRLREIMRLAKEATRAMHEKGWEMAGPPLSLDP